MSDMATATRPFQSSLSTSCHLCLPYNGFRAVALSCATSEASDHSPVSRHIKPRCPGEPCIPAGISVRRRTGFDASRAMDTVTPCFSDWRHSRRRNAGLRKKKNGVGLGRRRGSSRKPRSPLASIVTARIKRREYEEAARYPGQPNRLTVHATKRKKKKKRELSGAERPKRPERLLQPQRRLHCSPEIQLGKRLENEGNKDRKKIR